MWHTHRALFYPIPCAHIVPSLFPHLPSIGRPAHLGGRLPRTSQSAVPGCGHCAPQPAAGRTSSSAHPAEGQGGTVRVSAQLSRLPYSPWAVLTCSKFRARRVLPVYTRSRCSLSFWTKPSGTVISSTSTFSGSWGRERPTLMPGIRPPTWSCQPPPASPGLYVC